MKRFLAIMAAVALVAMPVMAETIIVNPNQIQLTPMGGTLGAPQQVTVGGQDAIVRTVTNPQRTLFSAGDTSHIYDNVPFVLGGAGSPGAGTWAFFDWVGTAAQWQDYITVASTGVVRHITYTYVGATGVNNTHTIQIRTGAIAPPSSVPGTFTGVGAPIATIVLPSLPGTLGSSFVQILVTGLNIPVGTSNLYVGFEEGGADDVFFLTGGLPGIGTTPTANGELIYFHPNYYGPGSPLSYNVPGYLYTGTGLPLHANITFALGMVPEPTTIGLLAAGGLLALRRRRA